MIDYLQDWQSWSSAFQIERSFSWIDFKVAELITTTSYLTFSMLPRSAQTRLITNIFPQGNTLLSMLTN